nr:NADH dehydrogenase subunit 2 [Zyginella mandali]
MKSNFNKIMFLIIIMLGVFTAVSSNNWIMIWCSLEIMLVSFMPIMISSKMITSQSTTQYFIIQSVSSTLLMVGVMLMVVKGDYNYSYLINTSLLIKMGVAPFHSWVLTVIEGLNYFAMFLLLTVMKIAPLMLLSYSMKSISLIIIITMMVGSVMGLNQNSLKKLIGYSSIYNMGLLISLLKFNIMWMLYLTVYSITLSMLMLNINKEKIKFINQMIIKEFSINKKLSLWLNMLSMGGMPPLLGFTIKFMVIQILMTNNFMIMLVMMILSSLLVMFFYLRMTFLSIMNFSSQNKTEVHYIKNSSMIMLIINMMFIPMTLTIKMLA